MSEKDRFELNDDVVNGFLPNYTYVYLAWLVQKRVTEQRRLETNERIVSGHSAFIADGH